MSVEAIANRLAGINKLKADHIAATGRVLQLLHAPVVSYEAVPRTRRAARRIGRSATWHYEIKGIELEELDYSLVLGRSVFQHRQPSQIAPLLGGKVDTRSTYVYVKSQPRVNGTEVSPARCYIALLDNTYSYESLTRPDFVDQDTPEGQVAIHQAIDRETGPLQLFGELLGQIAEVKGIELPCQRST